MQYQKARDIYCIRQKARQRLHQTILLLLSYELHELGSTKLQPKDLLQVHQNATQSLVAHQNIHQTLLLSRDVLNL